MSASVQSRKAKRHRSRRGVANGRVGGILLAVVLVSVLAAPLTGFDPNHGNLRERLEGPSTQHLLGTDQHGRDVLTRLLYGGRGSLAVGLLVVAFAASIGAVLGGMGSYVGGWTEGAIMRLMDVMLSIPGVLFAMTLVAIRGPGFVNVILAVGILYIPHFTRITRARVVSIRELPYIEAIRAIGALDLRVIARHILPNALGPVVAYATVIAGEAILVGAALGFLGVGVPPPTAEWGSMMAEARDVLYTAPLLGVAPGIGLTLTVLGFNLLGDWLRDKLDPSLR